MLSNGIYVFKTQIAPMMKHYILIALLSLCKTLASAQSLNESVSKVDAEIERILEQKRLSAAPIASDEERLRRLRLDLTGVTPSSAEVIAFLNDPRADKYEQLIQTLIENEDYVENWASIWRNWLVGRNFQGNPVHASELEEWLKHAFAKNQPYNEFVTELITASGLNTVSGASNFILRYNADPLQLASKTSSLFLGTSIKCAQCHDHPYNKNIKQTDFYGLAAYFSKTHTANPKQVIMGKRGMVSIDEREKLREAKELFDKLKDLQKKGKTDKEARRELLALKQELEEKHGGKVELKRPVYIIDENKGKVTIEREEKLTGEIVKIDVAPHFLNAQTSAALNGEELRKSLSALMVSPENPYFAKALINRYWAHFFGQGFAELEGLSSLEPSDYDAVWTILAEDFIRNGYDLKRLVKIIVCTKAYQRSSQVSEPAREQEWGEFAHQRVRPLSPDELFRVLTKTLDLKAQLSERMDEKKFEQFRDNFFRKFLTVFGNDEMEESETFNGTIPQSLLLQYGQITKPLSAKNGIVARIASSSADTEKVIQLLYLQFLSRYPTSEEIVRLKEFIDSQTTETAKVLRAKKSRNPDLEALENVAWVLLNSTEFITKH